jgi:1-acyl-sn-glycerol-3-phosphate acyltransferase
VDGTAEPVSARAEPATARRVDPARYLLRADLSPRQRWLRFRIARLVVWIFIRLMFRVRLAGRERLPDRPAVYCFNHLNWIDPLILLAALPARPQPSFYGPREETLRRGSRNRLMWWSGLAVPFRPAKDDLLTSVRRAQAVFDTGGVLAIAGEGGIHVHEGDLLPLQEGAAFLAMRARVPIVPLAISGTSWLRFRGRIVVRVGEPIVLRGRPTRAVVAASTAGLWHALHDLLADDRDTSPPGPLGRWLTDLFNDWGSGGRATAALRRGPRPEAVPRPDPWPGSPATGGSGTAA